MHSHKVVCPNCGTLNRIPFERPAAAARCGNCHQALFAAQPSEVDEAGFERHIRLNSIPVLLDMGAPSCGPCRTMAPQFARAATMLEPQVRLLKLNADEAPNISGRLGVRSIPALFLFHDGKVIARSAGAMNADAIVQWARNHLSPPNH